MPIREVPGKAELGGIAVAAWTSAALSKVGQRPKNEDRYLEAPDLALWAVADGMGGHADGEIASETALEALKGAVQEGQDLTEAVATANRATSREALRRGSDMGTTLVALRLHAGAYEVVWLGDSRAFGWDGQDLHPLTRDHTLVQHWVEEGRLSPEQARGHPYGHVLERAVGLDPEVRSEVTQGPLASYKAFLLATDGLTDALEERELAEPLRKGLGPRALQALARSVGNRSDPFQDNLTAVLVYSPQAR